ncbi:MAG TPA: type 1 glutamine amidotransferase [Opitutaceae bacterium]|nr:type 1 glutamine amidotransferase [Opitutaceae bacterium]
MGIRQQVLLVDAVSWAPSYPESPFRDVGAWFRRHFASVPGAELRAVGAETDLAAAVAAGTDAVIISGSPRDAWGDDPVNGRLCNLVHACRDRGTPVLGVCYGHQIIARALGAPVTRHPRGWEVGNTSVQLTPAGVASPLFAGLPPVLDVLSSHLDAVRALPPGAELLVQGEFTMIQGFHWQHQLFGVQFHPEMDPETVRFLWEPRRPLWRGRTAFDLDHTLDRMQPSPHGGQLLRNFIRYFA